MRFRKTLLKIAGHLPGNTLRVHALRALGCKIGPRTRIARKVWITGSVCTIGEDVIIGGGCVLSVETLVIGDRTRLLNHIQIQGQGRFVIGSDSRIISNHYFDCWNEVQIGNRSWIAGRGSQFWTHGAPSHVKDRTIVIGDDVYVGSGCLFGPGSGLGNGCLAAMGCVVSKRFDEPDTVVGGNPARVLMAGYRWRDNWG